MQIIKSDDQYGGGAMMTESELMQVQTACLCAQDYWKRNKEDNGIKGESMNNFQNQEIRRYQSLWDQIEKILIEEVPS